MDVRRSRYGDDDSDYTENKKQPKLLRYSAADFEEQDTMRRKSSGDKGEGKRKSGGSSLVDSSDEDDYEMRSCSKISRKNTEERVDVRSGEGYHVRDLEGSWKSRDDDNDLISLRKTYSSIGHESPESKGRSRVDNPIKGEAEKVKDRDSRYSDRKENTKDKGSERREQERHPTRRRWDEMDTARKVDDSVQMDRNGSRTGKSLEQGNRSKNELVQVRGWNVNSSGESCREGKRGDVERNLGRAETQDDGQDETTGAREARSEMIRDDKQAKVHDRSSTLIEDLDSYRFSGKSYIEKQEKHKQDPYDAHDSLDDVEILERSDEDVETPVGDTFGKEVDYRKSQSPSGSKQYKKDMELCDRGQSESENERTTATNSKEVVKDYKDYRSSKMKDSSYADRNMEWGSSKEHWRGQSKQDAKAVPEFDGNREWNSHRHESWRMDGNGTRSGYKKDNRSRNENGRFESSDSIEIKPNKNLDFVSEESLSSTFPARRSDPGLQQDTLGAAIDDEWAYQVDDRSKAGYGSTDDLQENFYDGVESPVDQTPGRNSAEFQSDKGRGQKAVNSGRGGQGQNNNGSSQPAFGNNMGANSFYRAIQQGQKAGKAVRSGRGRMMGRDVQRGGLPMHMMGPPFGHLGMPPGTMQSIGPNIPLQVARLLALVFSFLRLQDLLLGQEVVVSM
ncbi:hypothetical protein HPP92_018497 [Vanilla planifolia]|uniref:Uncharacterized protein n=1 Tax=Vanilla planifolia TaxID=51239 RepID=A0A835QFP9_VANPL|nr:hypothetical protein HPP92_018497 [Vanilla planifolia]